MPSIRRRMSYWSALCFLHTEDTDTFHVYSSSVSFPSAAAELPHPRIASWSSLDFVARSCAFEIF